VEIIDVRKSSLGNYVLRTGKESQVYG